MKTYIPKTTEWMRQNNWGAEAQQLVTADLTSCESCLAEAEREVEKLRNILDVADHCYCAIDSDGNIREECQPCCRWTRARLLNSEGRAGT